VLNSLFITPLHSDPWHPATVTHLAAVVRMRPAIANLGPLPSKLRNWLPDTLAGEREKLPTPLSWATGGTERDAKDWLGEMGDRELSYLLGFLNLKGLAAIAATCTRMRALVSQSSVWRDALQRLWPPSAIAQLAAPAQLLGWRRVAREMYSLEALRWRRLSCGGSLLPMRTNFSTCGIADRVYVFGGEGADSAALNDMFMLDLSSTAPAWAAVDAAAEAGARLPCGRWGHTLRELGDSAMLLYGGSSAEGPLSDAWLFQLAAGGSRGGTWHEVRLPPGAPAPPPRSWHGACTVGSEQLLIMGGCSAGGRLLADTWLLQLGGLRARAAAAARAPERPGAACVSAEEWPCWRELSGHWAPPARLGLSLVATEEGRVFAFGGLASAGPIRLRSQDAFTMDLRAEPPTWRYVSGSQLPSGIAAAGTPPPPRLEQVAGTLIGGRVLVFGGSMQGAGIGGGAPAPTPSRAWEPFVMSPNSETPTWRRLRVRGAAPRDAWGYSSCMLGCGRFIALGRYENDTLDLNELHELSLLSTDAGAAGSQADARVVAPSRGSADDGEPVQLLSRSDDSRSSYDGEEEEEEEEEEAADVAAAAAQAAVAVEPVEAVVEPQHRAVSASLCRPASAHLRGDSGDSELYDRPGSSDGGDEPMMQRWCPDMPAGAEDGGRPPLNGGRPQMNQEASSARPLAVDVLRAGAAEAPPPRPHAPAEQQPPAHTNPLSAVLYPVLPLMATGARLLSQAAGRLLGRGGAEAQQPPPQPQPPAGAAAMGAEETERRGRSLMGRGLAHPRPTASSGSDDEPPPKF